MERIKQALDKAREQRGTVESVQAREQPSVPERDAAAGITYTQTRSVSLSPELLKQHRVVAGVENDPAAAAYKMLRTQVLQRMKEHGWNALAITSPAGGAGKTLTAINLAISLAQEVNHTVLLVDLDLRRPSVHRYLGFEPARGLTDHLLRGTPLSEILVNPGIERLVVLPGREPIGNSSELLSSPNMVGLVDELKTRYPSRMVLFDLPPLLSADDALAFSPYVDAALIVVEEGKTTAEELKQAIDFLRTTNVLGTVLNKGELPKHKAYY